MAVNVAEPNVAEPYVAEPYVAEPNVVCKARGRGLSASSSSWQLQDALFFLCLREGEVLQARTPRSTPTGPGRGGGGLAGEKKGKEKK